MILKRSELLNLNKTKTNFLTFLYEHNLQPPNTIVREERWYRPYEPSFFVQADSPGQSQLTVNHVILGLNQAAMTMVLPANGFFEAKISLILNQRQIGTIEIYMGGSSYGTGVALEAAANITTQVSSTSYPTTNEIARGLVVDRTWPDMAVEWLYDEARSKAISENDMFTVIMSAFATASQSSPHDYCQSLEAASSESGSGATVGLVLGGPTVSKMLFLDVKTMLYLMYIKFIVSSGVYREFSFELQHDVLDVHEIWGIGSITIRGGGTSAVTATS